MSDYLERLEKYLDELEIKYFIADKFEGSDYEGYIAVYIDNDSFSRKILKELGFKEIENDFYYKKLEYFDKIKDEDIEDIKLTYSDKYSRIAKRNEYRKRIIKLKKIWDKIADKIYEINQYFFKKYGEEFFLPTLETLDLSLKLTNIVVSNERSFGCFCYKLYQFGREAILRETQDELVKLLREKYPYECRDREECKKFLKEQLLKNDPFYYQIDKLRHYEIHLAKKIVQEQDKNFLNEIKQIYSHRLSTNKLPTNSLEYFTLQMGILKDFYKFLFKIYEIITTKL